MKRLASVDDLQSRRFRTFMAWINGFARVHDLRVHTRWSKVWEYPWTWQYLCGLPFSCMSILDIGSEISPMPWFFASLGATVELVESDPTFEKKWQMLRDRNGFGVSWQLTQGAELPHANGTCDLVTSYSVIEHIDDKEAAIEEAVRVLKPGGLLCLTFDICERARGMTFPEWNGAALDMETFDRLVWRQGDLEPLEPSARWNEEDIAPFLEWHLRAATHHNYVVGGAILRKKKIPFCARIRTQGQIRVHGLDTGLGAGNTGDDAMFMSAVDHLPAEFDLSTEIHSMARTRVLPRGVRYLLAWDQPGIEQSIRESQSVLLMCGTPVMDAWGLQWPLQANAAKLELCHRLGKSVHAVGVGVDRLSTSEGERIFRKYYSPVTSWAVRSHRCKGALLDMGVPEQDIHLGADWAWLQANPIEAQWAAEWLRQCGAVDRKPMIGVNVVNEIWRSDLTIKRVWAALLDRLIEKHDAQVFFFCNESRPGEYFDRAAAEELRAVMRHPSFVLPDRYYLPSETISLLSAMHVTISQRYHFTLFSVLADVFPISVQRGQKMRALNEDLGLPFVGDMEHLDSTMIENEVAAVLCDAEPKLLPLRHSARQLKKRAAGNFSLVRRHLGC